MAVAALGVSVLYAVLLTDFGAIAFTTKKPLLMEELLVLPAVAVVLSFAARRVIRNSEGTRTGENLAGAAWWLALILGLCYAAYLFAVSFAIRQEAKGEVEKWIGLLNRGDEEGATLAFYRTLPPQERQNLSPNDRHAIQLRYRDRVLMFTNSDLVRLAQRNKGELSFAADSVNWGYKSGTVDCLLTGTVKCPEGSFPVALSLKGAEGVSGAEGGKRLWGIDRSPSGGYIDQSRAARTPYGWMVHLLEASGSGYGREYVGHTRAGAGSHYYAYRAYVKQPGEPVRLGESARERPAPTGWSEVARSPLLQLAFAGPAHVAGDAGYADYRANHFFALPGGARPDAARREQFFQVFDRLGLRPAGDRLRGPDGAPIDRESSITVTDSAVEVRVPVEVPLASNGRTMEAARGRVVVECRDPALLAELNQLKAAADPDRATHDEPDEVRNRKVSWRVVRVESDMAPVSHTPPPGEGGPGAPPPPTNVP
jgi:hypothetical protein